MKIEHNLICNDLVVVIGMVALSPQVAISTLDQGSKVVIHKNLNITWLENLAQPR